MGNCCIAYGSYVGTGAYGASNPNTLTFPFKPLVVFPSAQEQDSDAAHDVWTRPLANTASAFLSSAKTYITWTDNGISWYSGGTNGSAYYQHNTSGQTYHYIAIGIRE